MSFWDNAQSYQPQQNGTAPRAGQAGYGGGNIPYAPGATNIRPPAPPLARQVIHPPSAPPSAGLPSPPGALGAGGPLPQAPQPQPAGQDFSQMAGGPMMMPPEMQQQMLAALMEILNRRIQEKIQGAPFNIL